MIAGDGGAPAVKRRTGRSSRWASGWLTSMVSTVGAPQKWVASPRSRIPQIRAGSTAGMHTAVAPDRRARPGEAPAVAVEHRKRPEVGALLGEAVVQRHRQRVEVRAAVVVHHPLGTPGGARGVVDGDDVVLVLQPGLDLVLAALGEERLEIGREVDAAHRLGHLAEQVGQLRRVEDPARPGVLDDVGDVAGGQPGVDRDQDTAGLGHGEVGEQQRLAVQREEGDPVAAAQPAPAKRRGEAARARPPVAVGVPALAVDGGEPLGVDGAGALRKETGESSSRKTRTRRA